MSLPWRRKEANGEPPKEPERLPQRWAIIFGISGSVTLALSATGNLPAAVSAGVATVVGLHMTMT